MTHVVTSLVVWRVAAIAVSFVIAVSAVDIVAHIFRPRRHRVRPLK